MMWLILLRCGCVIKSGLWKPLGSRLYCHKHNDFFGIMTLTKVDKD
jgi:hypothetical protein